MILLNDFINKYYKLNRNIFIIIIINNYKYYNIHNLINYQYNLTIHQLYLNHNLFFIIIFILIILFN